MSEKRRYSFEEMLEDEKFFEAYIKHQLGPLKIFGEVESLTREEWFAALEKAIKEEKGLFEVIPMKYDSTKIYW